MDQFSSVDEIEYIKHVQDILDFYGVSATIGGSDSDDVTVAETDYQRPKYNVYNSTEWADYMSKSLETYKQMLAEEESSSSSSDDPLFGGLFTGDSGGLAGLAIIGGVLLFVFGFVTDLIPFVGD